MAFFSLPFTSPQKKKNQAKNERNTNVFKSRGCSGLLMVERRDHTSERRNMIIT